MTTFFAACAVIGAGVLLLQLLLGAAGVGDDSAPESAGDVAQGGLDLLSVRALASGLAMFGVGGLLGIRTPIGAAGGLLLGGVLGVGATLGVAYAMRAMLGLESDGTLRLENAIGITGQVYLGIPAARAGVGKIHVTVQGRSVELAAVTAHDRPLPTGASVVVIDVAGSDVVEVAPEAAILPTEAFHAAP